MMLTALFLGAMAGRALQWALQRFPQQVNRTLAQEYKTFYGQAIEDFRKLPAFPHYPKWLLPLSMAVISGVCWYIYRDTIAWGIHVSLLWLLLHIALTDWHYQLISTLNCVLLVLLGLIKVRLGLGVITPLELCNSLIFGLILSISILELCRIIYQRCAFGEGDCYLICALGCFLPWWRLPHLLFWASVCTLIGFMIAKLCTKKHLQRLPFAPGLVLAFAIVSVY
ncbi:prepilin peptidase [Spirabiliibacterium falconis]|uniref:prepilin peptidase n=1 Tax=Spirabiliibacterium falconis TaxID=572023 RepID=UPI001AAD8D47|nr:A24 family peptidase [Spirabiliibacterium falconis]MBE2895232.1 prepilin peptidase [Spirabiliibacterium falconis]